MKDDFTHTQFTMGFKDALAHGIDYRDYKPVSKLPADINLIAVAGVWGDYSNIRCLFQDENGEGYLRNIRASGGQYIIQELGANAKEINVGSRFLIDD
ncbi:hypothetical protein ACJKIH_24590 (plasmid) [Brucella pseudogrignonensis]|uniref:hypothetical protein n=1 Tax=Brucella pseudogrignonensis TaxID=419475 RepID=UPI0038B62AF2